MSILEGTIMSGKNDVMVIGPAIVDIMAGPIGKELFDNGTMPMETIQTTFGGNAYNEAVVLKHLGMNVDILTKVGADKSGNSIITDLKARKIGVGSIVIDENVPTSTNIVLFDDQGERRFLTNPHGSMRMLSDIDVLSNLKSSKIVSFSGMFISPLIGIEAMERIFRKIKENNECLLAVDMTKPKNGEKVVDLKPVLPYVDYIFPNIEEVSLLSENGVECAVEQLIDYGVKCVIVKKGQYGCSVYTNERKIDIPAIAIGNAIDTTGAGDSFAAGFLYGVHKGLNNVECAKLAMAAASCCVETVGATSWVEMNNKIWERYKLAEKSQGGLE